MENAPKLHERLEDLEFSRQPCERRGSQTRFNGATTARMGAICRREGRWLGRRRPLVCCVPLFVASCVDSDPPSGTGGGTSQICDTTPPMTSGGDWGPPFALDVGGGADETGAGIVYEPPPTQASDPTAWQYHSASGTYYRAPTGDEIDDNAWPEATLLLIPPANFVGRVTSGNATATVAVPMAEYPGNDQRSLPFETIALSRIQTHDSLGFSVAEIDTHGVVTDVTLTPSLHFYLPAGIDWDDHDATVVRVMASSRGGIELNGAKENDRTFRIHGPYDAMTGPYTLDIAPPSATGSNHYWLMRTGFSAPPIGSRELGRKIVGGLAARQRGEQAVGALLSEPRTSSAETRTSQCNDGLDNDADAHGDACDYECVAHPDFGGFDFDYTIEYEQTKNFVLVGSGPFCTRNILNYDAVMGDIGMVAAQMLNWLEPPSGQPRVPPLRLAWAACWEFSSYGEAIDCHADDELCADPSAYPFAGIGDDYGPSGGNVHYGYTGYAWSAVDHRAASMSSSELHPASMVVAIADQPPLLSSEVGIAYFPGVNPSSHAMTGAAVILAPDGLDAENNEDAVDFAGRRAAHELGHTLGLWHDPTPGSFMGMFGGTLPVVDWDADSLIPIYDGQGNVTGFRDQEFAWTQYAPKKWNPRSSGFGYTGCIPTNDECDDAHPDFSCVAGVCKP